MFNSKVSFKKNTLSAYPSFLKKNDNNLPSAFSLKTTQVEVKKNDITNPVVIDTQKDKKTFTFSESEKAREDKEKQRIEEVKKQREKVLSLIKKSFENPKKIKN